MQINQEYLFAQASFQANPNAWPKLTFAKAFKPVTKELFSHYNKLS